jgi:hypothetical protein
LPEEVVDAADFTEPKVFSMLIFIKIRRLKKFSIAGYFTILASY